MHCGPSTYPSNGCNTNVAVGIALLRSIEGSEFPIGFFICLALAPAWPPCPTQGSEFVICFSCDLPRFGAGLAPDNIGVARLISEGSEFVICFSKDGPRFGAKAPKTSATRDGSRCTSMVFTRLRLTVQHRTIEEKQPGRATAPPKP